MVSDYLVRLSIRSAMFAGAITGFVFGLFLGATLGALLSWLAGAIVDWQAQLGYSLGVTQQLLPLGDQVNSLESLSDQWFLVIPAVGVILGLVCAVIGSLAGGLWSTLVNAGVLPIHVFVLRSEERPVARRVRTRRRRAVGE
jgi:cobalamin synthase